MPPKVRCRVFTAFISCFTVLSVVFWPTQKAEPTALSTETGHQIILRLATADCKPGDLVGISDLKSSQLAVVLAVQGSKRRLSVGFRGKEQVVPARTIDLIHPQPGDVDPPVRLGIFPWTFDAEDLAQASPNCRDWGEAWVLILESDETVDLTQFAELACGTDAAISKAACWIAFHQDQDFFNLDTL